MTGFEVCFWLCAACVAYTYAGYPLLLGLLARWRGRPLRSDGPRPRSFSVVLAAHNEEASISRRLEELTALVAATGLEGEIVVVSDGSSDATVARASAFADKGVRVLALEERGGKAAALTAGCQAARGEILVFADVRQRWEAETLPRLLDGFADPAVGAVSGDLVVEKAPGVLEGVALYWRLEKWLRVREGRLFAVVGATGAVSAVRRTLFRPIPAGTLLDDVYWPLQVALAGYRVVHDSRARAFDQLPPRARDELRRKVRTLTGNFQLMRLLPAALLPWRNPIWVQYVSHKLLRLLAPWALLALLLTNLLLPGPLYRSLLAAQCYLYAVALLGLMTRLGARSRLVAAAASFLVLNVAAWLAFWRWIGGRTERSWTKVSYDLPRSEPSPQAAMPW